MTIFLLDVNVLIALIDPAHDQHDPCHKWFAAKGKRAWASCPLTQNGVLRIVGNRRYPNSPGSPAAVAELMSVLCALPGHQFWPDDISVLDHRSIQKDRILDSAQVTDCYLLALASAHNGQLATFDRRIVTDTVAYGAESICLLS